jgi:hypothetical protein
MESGEQSRSDAPAEDQVGEGRRDGQAAPIDQNLEEQLNAALPEQPDDEEESSKKQS